MKASETLDGAWVAIVAEVSDGDGYFRRRIQSASHWPVHAGIHRPSGARALFFEMEKRHLRGKRLRDETRGYSVYIGEDDAGRPGHAEICIIEAGHGDGVIFGIFCADIIEHWSAHEDAAAAIASLESRLACWRGFFRRETGLSRDDYVGLYGELAFLEMGARAGVPIAALVSSWQGMDASNQDFLFGKDAVEVKAVTANDADRVRITNARQLDDAGVKRLFLVRLAFDFRQDSGRTLPQLVRELTDLMAQTAPVCASLFEAKLLRAGFVPGAPHDLDDRGFTVRRTDAFRVSDGFPRLVESDLPAGVSEVGYTLNLSAAVPFRVTLPEIWTGV